MLTAGQEEILEAVAMIDGSTCDLTDLEDGQAHIKMSLEDLATEAEKLDDILEAIEDAETAVLNGQTEIQSDIEQVDTNLATAKTMIINGQTDIRQDIDSLSDDLETAKTMILAGQTDINNNIATLSSDLSTAKTMILDAIDDIESDISDVSDEIGVAKDMILDGQAELVTDISELSTQLTTVQQSILTELTNIHTKLDGLETGQEEICDKIEALDAKLDMIIDEVVGTCADGSTPVDGQCFSLSTSADDHDDAQAACVAMGGNLATMTADNAEALYALAATANNMRVWIGLTAESGSWAWEDGTDYPSGYMDWAGGTEPAANTSRCGQATASSTTDGEWSDITCNTQRQFICATASS